MNFGGCISSGLGESLSPISSHLAFCDPTKFSSSPSVR